MKPGDSDNGIGWFQATEVTVVKVEGMVEVG